MFGNSEIEIEKKWGKVGGSFVGIRKNNNLEIGLYGTIIKKMKP